MRGKDRHVLWLILDGMADRPASTLDGQTPLEAAETPHLDRLAAAGSNGTMDVSRPGTPLSSDRAHTLLFGYEHAEVPGRGVLEARGLDIPVPEGAVACSASFGRVSREGDRWVVTDRHLRDVSPDYESIAPTVATVTASDHERFSSSDVDASTSSGVDVSFTYTWKNRGIVVLDSETQRLSPAITDVDPFECGLPILEPEPLAAASDARRTSDSGEASDSREASDSGETSDPEAASRTAEALAAYTRWTVDRLAEEPVDVVLSKWAGTPTAPPAFGERHGLDACSLTPKPVLSGLAETLSMDVTTPAKAYDERAADVLAAVGDYEFVHAHYPEPDEVSHAAGPAEKRDELEAIDASLAPVADRALEDGSLVTVVTADHTTPSNEDVVHSGDPVPVTMVGETVRSDDVERAGERPAARGGVGRIRGRDLLRLSRAAADRVLLDGLRRTPASRDYPNETLQPLSRHESDTNDDDH
jgi:2,3-bisphosphoglycerate-independent phosphoglycerate mutase